MPQRYELRPEDSTDETIVGTTGMSEKSAGEVITISLTIIDDGTTRFEIHSQTSFKSTMFDWGVSAENIKSISGYLEKAAPIIRN